MPPTLLADLEFRAGAPGCAALGAGWSAPEPGFTWAVDDVSTLVFEVPPGHAGVLVTLWLDPVPRPQSIVAWCDGHLLGRHLLVRPGRVAIAVPAALLRDGRLALGLAHHDRVRICEIDGGTDRRLLSVLLRRACVHGLAVAPALAVPPPRDPLPPDQLFARFLALGDNCEFGLAQRRFGAEPLHLLRFTAMPLDALLRGLATGFDGLLDPGALSAVLDPPFEGRREYILREASYGYAAHSFVHEGDPGADTLLARAARRLAFQLRVFLEELARADKILVLKRNDPLSLDEVIPVWSLLRAHGDNTLLYVTPADAAHPPGHVAWVRPGLMHGRIDRFAPYDDAQALSEQAWLAICRAAHELWLGTAR